MRLNYIDSIAMERAEAEAAAETDPEEPGKLEKVFQAIGAQPADEDEEDWLL